MRISDSSFSSWKTEKKNNIVMIHDTIYDLTLRYLWNYYLYFPFFFPYDLICEKINKRNYIYKSIAHNCCILKLINVNRTQCDI